MSGGQRIAGIEACTCKKCESGLRADGTECKTCHGSGYVMDGCCNPPDDEEHGDDTG